MTTTKTNNNTFHALIEAMNEHANNNTIDTVDGLATLNALSTAICYSVLKKCIDPQRKKALEKGESSNSGCNPTLVKLWKEIATANRYAEQLAYCSANAESFEFNSNGDIISIIIDKDVADKLNKLVDERLNDSEELLQECKLAILEEVDNMKQRGTEVNLEKPYAIDVLSKRVYTDWGEMPIYKTKEVAPIQQVFRAVRRVIANNRSLCIDARSKYSYIEELTADKDGYIDTIYYRSGKYADIGGYAKDFNGSETLYTVSYEDMKNVNGIIKSLNLTARQAQILNLRLEGLSIHTIADRLQVSRTAVQHHLILIQKKYKLLFESIFEIVGYKPWIQQTKITIHDKFSIKLL